MTRVWPALWPPWKRTTTSARSDSQSTILPLPSSPHCEPMTTTFVIAFPSSFGDSYACGRAQNACRHNLLRREGAYARSEEHTSELQSLMRISYAVFCLKKKILLLAFKATIQHT